MVIKCYILILFVEINIRIMLKYNCNRYKHIIYVNMVIYMLEGDFMKNNQMIDYIILYLLYFFKRVMQNSEIFLQVFRTTDCIEITRSSH